MAARDRPSSQPPYRSGRSPHWMKIKNPKAPAVNSGGRGGLGDEFLIVHCKTRRGFCF